MIEKHNSERIKALEAKFGIGLDEGMVYAWQERLRATKGEEPMYGDIQTIYQELGGFGKVSAERLEEAFLAAATMGYTRKLF